jgi:hypothetical protein
MRRSLTRLATIALLCLTACRPTPLNISCGGGGDPLAEIVVAEASIEELSLWSASFVVGGTDGDGILRVVSDAGEEFLFNTMVQGSIIGLTAGANTQIAGVTVPIDIEGLSLTARDLVTSYAGVRAGADIIGGAQVRLLESEVGAGLVMGTFTVGLGSTPIAREELTLYLFDDPIGTGEVDDDYYYDEDEDAADDYYDCSGDGVCGYGCEIDDDCDCRADGFCDTACASDEDCACVDDDNTCTGGCGGADNDCLPNGWTCADERYGDGVCDEGCGFVDQDC